MLITLIRNIFTQKKVKCIFHCNFTLTIFMLKVSIPHFTVNIAYYTNDTVDLPRPVFTKVAVHTDIGLTTRLIAIFNFTSTLCLIHTLATSRFFTPIACLTITVQRVTAVAAPFKYCFVRFKQVGFSSFSSFNRSLRQILPPLICPDKVDGNTPSIRGSDSRFYNYSAS